MAVFNARYGYQWTPQEREERKQPVRQVQRLVAKVEEQARRIQQHLPQFAEAAGEIVHSLNAGLKPLLELNLTNRGPKYYSIPPDEADRLLAEWPGLLRSWTDFANAPGFAGAARRVGREIRRRNAQVREHNRAVLAAHRAEAEKMQPAFELLHQGDILGALEHAAKSGLL